MHWIESSQNSFVEVPTPKVYLGDGVFMEIIMIKWTQESGTLIE